MDRHPQTAAITIPLSGRNRIFDPCDARRPKAEPEIYDRHDYSIEERAALERLDAYLKTVLATKRSRRVLGTPAPGVHDTLVRVHGASR